MYSRRMMYDGVYTLPYRHHRANVYPSYDIARSLPSISDINIRVSPYYPDYNYRRSISYGDYPYYNYIPRTTSRLPIIEKNICYYYDDPGVAYDIIPKHSIRSHYNRLASERITMPRSTVVQHYERARPSRLVPIYHSSNPQYIVSSRRSYVV